VSDRGGSFVGCALLTTGSKRAERRKPYGPTRRSSAREDKRRGGAKGSGPSTIKEAGVKALTGDKAKKSGRSLGSSDSWEAKKGEEYDLKDLLVEEEHLRSKWAKHFNLFFVLIHWSTWKGVLSSWCPVIIHRP